MNLSNIIISNDKSKLDIKLIHNFLISSYWAKSRTIDDIKTTIEYSECYGVFINNEQIGFARIVTDFITIAYLMDVFIISGYQKKGYSKLLLKKIFEDPKFYRVQKWMLSTADAHSLYEKFGFKRVTSSEKLMEMIPTINVSNNLSQ